MSAPAESPNVAASPARALKSHYDALVIGCGMSGLGAAIRLAMSGRSVLVVERHNAPGGLNGYYFKAGRKFDVGLHAMTNYAAPGKKGPLTKIFRQLRIPPEAFDLSPQLSSRISFPGEELRFANGIDLLESEVARAFPKKIDAFRDLVRLVEAHDALDISRPQATPARALVHERLGDPLLAEMILNPLFYYGSALQNDIDLDQFCILFRALYLEGFARPFEGVRRILRVLLDRYKALGGERLMKCGVRRLVADCGHVAAVELDDGRTLTAGSVLSTIGSDETLGLLGMDAPGKTLPRHGYAEHIACMKPLPSELGWKDTIVFFSNTARTDYRVPDGLVDPSSGVVCMPANYDFGTRRMEEGMLRVTVRANHRAWKALSKSEYAEAKKQVAEAMMASALGHLPGGAAALPKNALLFEDTFTPLTVEKFTGHISGSVYGSPVKVRDGRTPCDNLFLCGTDQGFLGIVGAILGGISIANLHVIGPGA